MLKILSKKKKEIAVQQNQNQKYQTIKNQFDAIHHITNPFPAFMTTG